MNLCFIFALAVILDLIFGDSSQLPHPVRSIGAFLNSYEDFVRKFDVNLFVAGWLGLFLCVSGALLLVYWVTLLPYIGFIFAVYFSYAGLALGCLLKECQMVERHLQEGNITQARLALSMLVSRETEELSIPSIRKTLAETLSENLNDGFVAPVFYLALFGPAGLWAYKAVSTMDSMWGYKTERYEKLGFACAKTDDVLAYIPARITALALCAVSFVQGNSMKINWTKICVDAKKMESPNAGWPMAAAAWLMNAQMGGRTRYFGKLKEKPRLGPDATFWNEEKIASLFQLCRNTGISLAGLFLLCLLQRSIFF